MNEDFIKDAGELTAEELINNDLVIAGLDIGDKTVGISVSDRRIKIATGIGTLLKKFKKSDFEYIVKLLQPYKVGFIVFGWPLQMDGTVGEQCKRNFKFAEELHKYIDVPFIKWDERFSTKVMDRIMIGADLSRSKRKKIIDKAASAYILQGFIDFLNKNQLKVY